MTNDSDDDLIEGMVAHAAAFVTSAEDNGYQNFEKETEYYDGVMRDLDGEEKGDPGRSQAVSRDVADVIGWIMPQLMRIFMGADNTVEYEPEEAEDEDAIDDATVYINSVFRGPLKGYRLLWDSIHDACLHRIGILKAEWDSTPEYGEKVLEDVDDVEWTRITSLPGVEVVSHEAIAETATFAAPMMPDMATAALGMLAGPQFAPDLYGGPLLDAMTRHSGKIRWIKSEGRLTSSVIPRDQFLIEAGATSIEDSDVGEKRTLRRSDLVEMGFDKDLVWDVPSGNDDSHSGRRYDETYDSRAYGPKETDEVDYFELYLLRDVDGDGVAERVKACFAGIVGEKGLLHWEVWPKDEVPYTALVIEPVPHRFDGRSIYDATADVQKIKTVLERNLLDSAYDSVDPMVQIDTSLLDPDYADESLEALQNPSSDRRLVFGKQGVAAPIVDKVADLNAMMGAMTVQDGKIEKRTGISRATMALDPETLQNQTATAAQLQHSAQYSKVELVARNLAELGLNQYFALLYRLVHRHEKAVKRVRVGKNRWREVRPSEWPESPGVLVNVGLGTGNRERDVQSLAAIRNTQMGYMQLLGPDNPFVTIDQIRRSDEKIMQAMGIRNADAFISDPAEEEVAEWQQKRAQAAQQPPPEVQMKMAQAQADAELKKQQAAQDHELRMMEAKERIALDRWKFEQQMILKREQLQAELQLKGRLAAMDAGAVPATPVYVGGEPG